jgi:hypothetical protein
MAHNGYLSNVQTLTGSAILHNIVATLGGSLGTAVSLIALRGRIRRQASDHRQEGRGRYG